MRYGLENFEMGDEPVEVQRALRPSMMLSVRLSPEETEEVRQFARAHKMSFEQLCRLALTEYLWRAQQPPPGIHVTAGTTGEGSLTVVVNGAGGNRTEGGQTRAIIDSQSVAGVRSD